MKKFIIKTATFVSVVLLIVAASAFYFPVNPDDYLAAYNKKIKLLETTPSPRIIFAGGSNLAFGLDSKRIQDSMHLPVVNTGLHAGIGLKLILDDLEKHIRPNDIVIVAAEYSHFYGGMYGESFTLGPFMRFTNWEKLDLLNMRQWMLALAGSTEIMKHGLSKTDQYTYLASNFNEFGDEVKHWTLDKKMGKVSPGTLTKEQDYSGSEYIKSILIRMKEKGADVLMIPPIVLETYFNGFLPQVSHLEKYWEDNEFPYLISPSQHALPDSCGYDTPYHMRKSGVDRYTTSIIQALKIHMGK